MSQVIALAITIALSLLFFMAARHKMNDLRRFRAQLMAYELVPVRLVCPTGNVLPWLEFAIFAGLLIPLTRSVAAVLAAGLLMLYAGAMGINLLRGRQDIDCGCGGKPQGLSWWLVARNMLLSGAALMLLVPGSQRDMAWADIPFLISITALLVMLYIAVGQLVSNHSAMTNRSSHG